MDRQMTRMCHACGHMRTDHRSTCDWKPTNKREPSHNWAIASVIAALLLFGAFIRLIGGWQ